MPVSDRDEALRELGRMARDRRENAHISLDEVFERTRVRLEFLEGIEEGDYSGFPDLVYVRGFVRTYLGVIGAEDLKDDFLAWLSRDTTRERAAPPTNVLGNGTSPTKGFRPASRFWLFVLLFLLLIGTGGYVWYSWAHSDISIGDIRPFDPGGALVPGNVVSEEKTSPDVLFLSSGDHAGLTILPVSTSVAPVPKPEPPKPSLHIKARGDLWMKVTIGNEVLFSKTLKSGLAVSWDLPSPAKVTFGRPNMADVILNGKNLGVPNPEGSKKSETWIYNPDGTHKKL